MKQPTESQRIRKSYPDEECPDCGEPIPKNVVDGQACKNCGHVYYLPREND